MLALRLANRRRSSRLSGSSRIGLRRIGFTGWVIPSAAQRLEERGRIHQPRCLRLNPANDRLVIGLLREQQCQDVD